MCAADGMRRYFLPPRFYSTEFPYAGLKLKMVRGASCPRAAVCPETLLHGPDGPVEVPRPLRARRCG